MSYIWSRTDWPHFTYDPDFLTPFLDSASAKQAELQTRLERLGFDSQQQQRLSSLTLEVLDSSIMEGEVYYPESVRSSIALKLGLPLDGPAAIPDKKAEGLIQILLDANQNFSKPLTEERLLGWHRTLMAQFPVRRGAYRKEGVFVLSGSMGKEKIHFEGPPASGLLFQMQEFLDWLESPPQREDLRVRSAVGHLWFVTVHPFEDGNGRIARVIGEMLLARADAAAERFYSMSSAIAQDRRGYYRVLAEAQSGGMNVTPWLEWYLTTLGKALDTSLRAVQRTLDNSHIWTRALEHGLNPRQKLMLSKILAGFDGWLTSSKWAALCKCSQDTASRDFQELIQAGILEVGPAGGRSTHYVLAPVGQGRAVF